ncbi:hypothetical protein P7K49_024249 [Saguinus oedipus]|uniref:Uncharacterized protein n=1 Tax=Saguinus oedipus TaxID=9490 RepID=A0ABQ9UQL7_SAGOE|nr:hypothetical protein P7K49_024249 [Saguinus oedipus]
MTPGQITTDHHSRQPVPGSPVGRPSPPPPPSAPAFPDGIRARFRSEEAPCLFILHAFLPQKRVNSCARLCAQPRRLRPSSPRESRLLFAPVPGEGRSPAGGASSTGTALQQTPMKGPG